MTIVALTAAKILECSIYVTTMLLTDNIINGIKQIKPFYAVIHYSAEPRFNVSTVSSGHAPTLIGTIYPIPSDT